MEETVGVDCIFSAYTKAGGDMLEGGDVLVGGDLLQLPRSILSFHDHTASKKMREGNLFGCHVRYIDYIKKYIDY